MTLLYCYTGACAVTLSLRHHHVTADELSLTTREEGVRTGGERHRQQAHSERKRERETGWVLPPLTHTRASLSNSGRTERASFPHPLQENKTAFSFEWIIQALARLYIIQHNQSLRHCRGRTEPSVEAVWKQKDPSAPGTATMAPMVEEGSQFGESRSPFNTFTHPALNVALNPVCCRSNGAALFLNCYLCICGSLIVEIYWK